MLQSLVNASVTRELDWEQFLGHASQAALTEPARALILHLNESRFWAQDVSTARVLQQETQEISALLDRDSLWNPLSGLVSLDPTLELLQKGGTLDLSSLVLLRAWLIAQDIWFELPREEVTGDRVKRAISSLPNASEPLRILDRVLTPDGQLNERASPLLASLYNEIRATRLEVHSVLEKLRRDYHARGILQENFTDHRDGRYVLPVKISHQNEIDGIVYEASASGQTVFIEPVESSRLNNRLRQKQNELLQEIHRILVDTSKKMEPFREEILHASEVLVHWDLAQAKARIGRKYSGKTLTLAVTPIWKIEQTANPLLWWTMPESQIVRNTIEMEAPHQSLLITGPNTGGKTVLLKTLGLCAICARTGFPFPAVDRPIVPFFDRFFVDLGDHQSLERQLSSFSGHVARMKEVLEGSTSSSLVLLDELNSATDPEEGYALSRAFLESVLGQGAWIVTTTHDPLLKAWATQEKRILNTSMAFDEAALVPTYRMVLGVPGRSRALETARRLGIPESVLGLAEKYLSKEHRDFENMLTRLSRDAELTERARKEAVALKLDAERLRDDWLLRTREGVEDVLTKTRTKLKHILEKTQDQAREHLREFKETRVIRQSEAFRKNLDSTLSQAALETTMTLKEEAPEIAELLEKRDSTAPVLTPDSGVRLTIGAEVRVPKWKSTGTILDVTESGVKVALGKLQMNLSHSDVELLPEKKRKSNDIRFSESSYQPATEIDLRGMRFDDAMGELGRYLDLVFRSGSHAEVTIVHGLGTGAIREGTRKLLEKLPYVAHFQDGGVGRGGTGATVVRFDR